MIAQPDRRMPPGAALDALSRLADDGPSLAGVPFEPYEGPATFHVDGSVYRIPQLRLDLQPSPSIGKGFGLDRPVVIVLERGELPKSRTEMGELRLGDHQEFTAWWTWFRFEL
jgi:hypothetical protein